MRPDHVSTGERVVYCTRVDCAFVGDAIPVAMIQLPEFTGRHWYVCEAEIVVLDRRAKYRKTCGRFAKK